MNNPAITGTAALLLGAALVSGCNRGQDADSASTAGTMPAAPDQPAGSPADRGATSTAVTEPAPIDATPATTMGNASDSTAGDMTATGTDASGMNGATDSGNASGTNAMPASAAMSGKHTGRNGSDKDNNTPPPDQGSNP